MIGLTDLFVVMSGGYLKSDGSSELTDTIPKIVGD